MKLKHITLVVSILVFSSMLKLQALQPPIRNGISFINESIDSTRIAVLYSFDTSYQSIIDVYDNQSGSLLYTVDVSPLIPQSLALNQDGGKAVISIDDGSLYIVEFGSPTTITKIWRENTELFNIKWDPFNNRFGYIIANQIMIFDLMNIEPYVGVRTEDGAFYDFFWDTVSNKLVSLQARSTDIFSSVAESTSIKLWTLQSNTSTLTPDLEFASNGFANTIAVSSDGTKLALALDFSIEIYNITNFSLIIKLNLTYEDVYDMKWSSDDTRLLTGGDTIAVWDTSSWSIVNTIPAPRGVAQYVNWSLDEQSVFHTGNFDELYRNDTPVSALPTPTPSPTLNPTPTVTCSTPLASGNNAALISAIPSGKWCG